MALSSVFSKGRVDAKYSLKLSGLKNGSISWNLPENGAINGSDHISLDFFIHMMAEISPNGLCRLKKASLPEEESVKSLTFPNFDNSGKANQIIVA